jgi:hypothetical protein
MSPHPMRDRLALLRMGANVLQSRMPTWQARFSCDGVAFRARFEWPGVVTVADDNTGETLARSMPGRPTEPDADTMAHDLRGRRA